MSEIVAADGVVGSPGWMLRDAVRATERADVDALAVVDDAGMFVGLVRTDDVVKLEEILDETGT